jgi:phosphoglycolate phosphatase-like HAD superfamily hydrolase
VDRGVTFLCDLDGVLVDSTAAIRRTWRDWAVSHGLDPDEVEDYAKGPPATEVIAGVAPGLSVAVEAKRVEDAEVLAAGDVTAMPLVVCRFDNQYGCSSAPMTGRTTAAFRLPSKGSKSARLHARRRSPRGSRSPSCRRP